MNHKALQWIALAALLAAAGLLFLWNRHIAAGVTAVSNENQELRVARNVLQQTAAAKARQADQELARLRKEAEDTQRLREQEQQLRAAQQNLSQQVAQAQARAQAADNQARTAQAQAQVLQARAAQADAAARSAQAALATQRTGSRPSQPAPQLMDPAAAAATCISNLRRLDAAKHQWAMENLSATSTAPALADLAPYLQNDVPICPAGGTYTPNAVGLPPACSRTGHVLPK